MNKPTEIRIPAEQWEVLASTYSCQAAVEHKGNKPLPVQAAEYGGFLYTAFSVMYGPYGETRKPRVDAYRLIPASVYIGETTLVYHDEKAIQAGLRERGDHTGLIVSVVGKRMVCAERVRFIMDTPNTRPLSEGGQRPQARGHWPGQPSQQHDAKHCQQQGQHHNTKPFHQTCANLLIAEQICR